MSNDKGNMNMSVLNNDDVLESFVNTLKDKMPSLDAQHSENLSPKVRKQLEVLTEIQSQHDELEANFVEEKAALEAKYRKLYQPLLTKQHEFLDGVLEVGRVTKEVATEKEECKAAQALEEEKLLKKKMKKGKPITKTENHEDAVKELQNQMEQILCILCATRKEKAPISSDHESPKSVELGEAIKHASIILADGLRDYGLAIRETNEYQMRRDKEIKENQMRHDIELREKLKKLYREVWSLSVGSLSGKFRAFYLIGQDNTLINLFESIPDLHKEMWVETLLRYDNKQYHQCQGGNSSMSQGNPSMPQVRN